MLRVKSYFVGRLLPVFVVRKAISAEIAIRFFLALKRDKAYGQCSIKQVLIHEFISQ